jgi:AAA family ATP:ADP antiporter
MATEPQDLLPAPAAAGGEKKPKKAALGFVEGVRYLMQDEYIMCLAALVMAYGVSINLVEVTWKNQLKHHFTSPVGEPPLSPCCSLGSA